MNQRRHRKLLASLLLGMWLFALFVGVANTCMVEEASAALPMSSIAMEPGQIGDHVQPAGCEQFCKADASLFSKLRLVQDQPPGQPCWLQASPCRARLLRRVR